MEWWAIWLIGFASGGLTVFIAIHYASSRLLAKWKEEDISWAEAVSRMPDA
jgi:hypothetical protein